MIPIHGTINFTGTKVGDIAEQSCDLGYELAGFKVITCLDDGLWSHPPVTCSFIGKAV